MKIKLGEALRYEQPTKYIVASEKYNDSYATPVLTAGKSFILGYTNEESGIYDNLPVIIFDDFTTDIKYVDFPFKVKSSAMKMLQPANENYNLKFFYYLIKYMNFQPTSHQRHWISKFAEMEFDIPERVKQDQIVEKLDKLVEMQSKKTTQLKKYDDLVKSQFIEMFENEKFENVNLENVCTKITDGSHNPPKGIDFSNYPMLSSQNINQQINFSNVRYLNEADFLRENKRTQVAKGDILVTIVGTIGRSVVVQDEIITLQRSVAVIKPNSNMNSYYINQYLKSETAQKQFSSKAHGSSQKGVYLGDLKKLQIPTPPIELQNQFADFVKHIDKLKYNDVLMEVA